MCVLILRIVALVYCTQDGLLGAPKIFWTRQTQRAPGEHYRCVDDRITLFKNSEQAGLAVVAVQNLQEKRYVFMVNPG